MHRYVIFNGGYIDTIDIDIIELIGYFGKYFESLYETLDFVQCMYGISRLDIWCFPSIWQIFIDSKFIDKLQECYLSNNGCISEIEVVTFVNFVIISRECDVNS